MIIGSDLDNTLIDFGDLFRDTAVERGLLPVHFRGGKTQVREEIWSRHGNAVWTELQGLVYGERLSQAKEYPQAKEFFRRCQEAGTQICILSHKTAVPVHGGASDLRKAALSWLEDKGWFSGTGLEREDVEFHEERALKLRAIGRRGCAYFIDDLPEVLSDSRFPVGVEAVLFDPEGLYPLWSGLKISSWGEAGTLLLERSPV